VRPKRLLRSVHYSGGPHGQGAGKRFCSFHRRLWGRHGPKLGASVGQGGPALHNWFYPTRAFRSMIGQDGGTDDRFAAAAMEGLRRLHPQAAICSGRQATIGVAPDWKRAGGATTPRITRRPLIPDPPRPGTHRDGGRHDFPISSPTGLGRRSHRPRHGRRRPGR